MKIVAVRGKNLASLANHFEVDFRKPPLDRAGLIAITGATGSGKTTLLDAICLALFDRTPRFANRGGVVIGAGRDDAGLRATDVRSILRHGAVEGWAEVDFLGVDDRLWRARWEVRRARGRADGRIQAQTMKLVDPLAGEVIAADRKSDTLAAIEVRLGLDFDQFRRSVLLAQGEFSAFLEASGSERAELLERMTGTWLYREIGRGAFERAKLAERERDELERERERLQILTDERRSALEAELERQQATHAGLAKEASELEAARRWHESATSLAAALTTARTQLERAREGEPQLREHEQLIASVERVAALRERVTTRDRWARELSEREADLTFIRGELPLIETQRAELGARVGAREAALEAARERRRRLATQLERARELDTKLAGLGEQHARTAAKLASARQACGMAATQLEHLDEGLRDAQRNLERTQAWLDAHAGLGPLSEHWPHYRSLLQQQQRALEGQTRGRAALETLAPRVERSQAQLEHARRARTQARRKRTQARARLQKLERELDDRPALAELRLAHSELDACRGRLSGLRTIHEEFVRVRQTRAELELERREQKLERDHRRRELRRMEGELEARERAFEQAKRGLRQLEVMRDLVEYRAALRPGEACPVCGADEHPAAGKGAPEDDLVVQQRERVASLLRERDELQREQGEHQGREQLASQRLTRIGERTRLLRKRQTSLQHDWTKALGEGPVLPREPDDGEDDADADQQTPESELDASEAGGMQLSLLGAPSGAAPTQLPDQLDEAGLGPALWTVQDELDRRARSLALAREDVESLLERQRRDRARRDEVQELLDATSERVEQASRELDALTREGDETRARLESLDVDIDARWGELEDVVSATLVLFTPPLAGFEIDGEAGPGPEGESGREPECESGRESEQGLGARLRAGFERHGAELISRLSSATTRFTSQRSRHEQSVEGARTLGARRAELAAAHRTRAEAEAELGQELAALDTQLVALRDERAQVLDGRPASAVSHELEGAIELAERERDASKDSFAKVERELQAQRTRVHTLVEQVGALSRARADAQAAVDGALEEAGLEPEHVEALLGREALWAEGWLAGARAELDAGRAALARASAVVDERERVVAEHEAQGHPELGPAQVATRASELGTRRETLRRAIFAIEHPLQRDREDRALAAHFAPRLDQLRRAARVWGRLREAIGSATGDKFQKFAQSLTLELLLAEANAQLRELKPRYALSRVPGHDLELQLVDHDLGDEIRSIRGLSGGEKFLVSLALALALAGLSSEDCRIESLFIDEGFGTLDAQSLDIAVSTLDALQADGRQIGVISHVHGLAERIGVEIRVEAISSGRSRVRIVSDPRGLL